MIKEKERITYIDAVKGIAILLMLLGHILIFFRNKTGNNHSDLLILIYTFHMQVFFILSGILYNEKKWQGNIVGFVRSRFRTLMIPYIFFDIIGGIINLFINNNINYNELRTVVYNTITIQPNIGPNWFFSAMFIANILTYICIKYYKEWFKYIMIIPIFIIAIKQPIESNVINIFARGIIGFYCMILGYKLRQYYCGEIVKRWDSIIISFIILVVISKLNGQLDVWSCTINNPILMLIGGLTGAYCLIGIAQHFNNFIFQYVGKNTITLLCTHLLLIKPMHAVLRLGDGDVSIIILFIMIVVIQIPLMYIFDKFLPFLVGKKRI